jgi:hypothetical protein
MTVSYIDNYKTIRNKFRPPVRPVVIQRTEVKEQPTPVVVLEPEQIEELPEIERWARYGSGDKNYRDMMSDARTLRIEAEKRGISFYTKLMEGMPTVSNRLKLATVVVLEEYAIDWKTLFDKDRSRFKTAIRWKVFDALREEGLSFLEIARLCDVDHTSVMHGLKRIRGEYNVGR